MALLAWAHFVSMVMADRDADVTRDFPSASHGNLQPPTSELDIGHRVSHASHVT